MTYTNPFAIINLYYAEVQDKADAGERLAEQLEELIDDIDLNETSFVSIYKIRTLLGEYHSSLNDNN